MWDGRASPKSTGRRWITVRYAVGIPYYFWCEVEADSPEEALEKAHDTEGKMGESEDFLAIVTHVCPECGGPPDDRVLAGMKCGPCAYK